MPIAPPICAPCRFLVWTMFANPEHFYSPVSEKNSWFYTKCSINRNKAIMTIFIWDKILWLILLQSILHYCKKKSGNIIFSNLTRLHRSWSSQQKLDSVILKQNFSLKILLCTFHCFHNSWNFRFGRFPVMLIPLAPDWTWLNWGGCLLKALTMYLHETFEAEKCHALQRGSIIITL